MWVEWLDLEGFGGLREGEGEGDGDGGEGYFVGLGFWVRNCGGRGFGCGWVELCVVEWVCGVEVRWVVLLE